jgi:DNA-binding transcriptional LysR family regulator
LCHDDYLIVEGILRLHQVSVQYIVVANVIVFGYIMELRHMRYFVAVAEELNFTRAAARIGIGQPPLSQQIKDLETELGTHLFIRTPHGVLLTEAGQVFLQEARQLLAKTEQAKSAVQRAGRGESGRLRLGFTAALSFHRLIPAVIRDYRRTWPDVGVELEESNTTLLSQGLARETLDAAFLRPGLATLPGIDIYRFADEPMRIALPTGHPLAHKKSVALRELANESFVLFPREVGLSLYDEIIDSCRRAGFEPRLNQVAPQMTSVINLVAAEMGISIVTASMTQIQVPGVCYVSIKGDAPVARLALATRQGDPAIVVANLVSTALRCARGII